MTDKPDGDEINDKIMAFFCVNLLAAYAPAVLCIMALAGIDRIDNPALVFLTSPVAVAAIATSYATNDAGGWFFLAALILLLCWASAAFHNSRKAWVAIPSIVFVYSLLQGVLAARFINGFGGG